ncbi:RNF family protein [Schizosaccharomyces japonicus yFS275]|uniref:RNF family protein n=1 Tax=Schizosaccharomyces japonicus (strain yFS275 / FY16936) TaxID=402676 RepID=B6JY48_SCHJY|nr:RNF family protein [Schizosaccharomyces japonicus yFS275]EEB06466.2 RNF family protein [Schizosaccharomyces japonicus yFS275]
MNLFRERSRIFVPLLLIFLAVDVIIAACWFNWFSIPSKIVSALSDGGVVTIENANTHTAFWAQIASFGKQNLFENSTGLMIHLETPAYDNPDGCFSMSPDPVTVERKRDVWEMENGIVRDGTYLLVNRGGCTFEKKALEAQNRGFQGIIVGETRGRSTSSLGLVRMLNKTGADDIYITALFVQKTAFIELKLELLDNPHTEYIIRPLAPTNALLQLLFAFLPFGIGILVYETLVLVQLVSAPVSPSSSFRLLNNAAPAGENGSSDEDDETLLSVDEATCRALYGVECVICLKSFTKGDTIVCLPCGHQFHRPCITTWLVEYRPVCPTCNIPVSQMNMTAKRLSA